MVKRVNRYCAVGKHIWSAEASGRPCTVVIPKAAPSLYSAVLQYRYAIAICRQRVGELDDALREG